MLARSLDDRMNSPGVAKASAWATELVLGISAGSELETTALMPEIWIGKSLDRLYHFLPQSQMIHFGHLLTEGLGVCPQPSVHHLLLWLHHHQ